MKKESKITGVFTRRTLLMAAGQIGVFGALAARLYQVQVEESAKYATLAESNRISARLIAPPRGHILDRFGTVIGGNKLNWRALLMVEETADVSATLDAFTTVVPIADHERARIDREMHRRRRFIPIVVREFLTWDEMAAIGGPMHPTCPASWSMSGHRGSIQKGPALAHVVGYVAPPSETDMGDDPLLALPGIRVGRAGIERFHDLKLRGRAGEVQMEVNAVGRVIRELDRQEGTPGQDIRPDHRCGTAEPGAVPAGRPERLRRGDGLPQRRSAGDDHHAVLRPQPVQLGRVAGAVDRLDQ